MKRCCWWCGCPMEPDGDKKYGWCSRSCWLEYMLGA